MSNKGKGIKLELIIIFATVVIALILVFSFNGVTVENRHQAIDPANAYKSIIFDLKTGQHVSGLFNYTGDDSGTWFAIYDPKGNHLITASNTRGNHTGSFSFTAATDGKYYLGIDKDTIFNDYIDYEYTVSPAILSLDKTDLTIIVIAVGALSTIIALKFSRREKTVNLGS